MSGEFALSDKLLISAKRKACMCKTLAAIMAKSGLNSISFELWRGFKVVYIISIFCD